MHTDPIEDVRLLSSNFGDIILEYCNKLINNEVDMITKKTHLLCISFINMCCSIKFFFLLNERFIILKIYVEILLEL